MSSVAGQLFSRYDSDVNVFDLMEQVLTLAFHKSYVITPSSSESFPVWR